MQFWLTLPSGILSCFAMSTVIRVSERLSCLVKQWGPFAALGPSSTSVSV